MFCICNSSTDVGTTGGNSWDGQMTEICNWKNMVEGTLRNGIWYKKFTDVPFTGKVTGRGQGKLKKGVQVGPWVTYHKNGQLWSKGTYKNEKRDGPWVIYYETGRLQTKGTQQDGEWDGPYVLYHENGQLKSKGNWKNGGLAGPWVFYLPNGQLSWEGTYKDDVKISD